MPQPYQQVQQQSPLGGTNWSGNTVTTSYDPRLLNDLWATIDQRQGSRDLYGAAAGNAYSMIANGQTDPRTGLPSLAPTTQQVGYDRGGFLGIPGADDFSGQQQRVENAMFDRFASRAGTRFGQQRTSLENTLRDQGFMPGSEGYDAAMRDFSQAENDAYAGAARDAVMGGGAESSRLLADALRIRGQQGSEAQQDLMNFNAGGNTNFGQRLAGAGQGFAQNMGAQNTAQQWLGLSQAGLPQGTMLPNFDLGLQGIDEDQGSRNAWMAGLSELLGPALTGAIGSMGGNGGDGSGILGRLARFGPQIANWLNSALGGDSEAMDPTLAYGDGSGWAEDIFGGITPEQIANYFGSDMSWLNDAYG